MPANLYRNRKGTEKICCNLMQDLSKLAALKTTSCAEDMSTMTGLGSKVIKVEEAPSCSSTNSVAQDSSSVIIAKE